MYVNGCLCCKNGFRSWAAQDQRFEVRKSDRDSRMKLRSRTSIWMATIKYISSNHPNPISIRGPEFFRKSVVSAIICCANFPFHLHYFFIHSVRIFNSTTITISITMTVKICIISIELYKPIRVVASMSPGHVFVRDQRFYYSPFNSPDWILRIDFRILWSR